MILNTEIAFVRILVPIMTGIYCFYSVENPIYISIIILINGLLIITLLTINALYKNFRAYRFKHLISMFLFVFLFTFGAALCLLNNDRLKQNYFAKHPADQLKIWIADEPQKGNSTLRFTAHVTQSYGKHKFQRVSGKILVTIKTDSLCLQTYDYGDELIITAIYSEIAKPHNPAEFDFKAWLSSKNVYQQTYLPESKIYKTNTNKGSSLIKYALLLRKRQIAVYRKLITDEEAFAVASTLILGYRADLSDETLSAYSKTGTIHALSVSGMHVGIIYIVLNWILSFLDKRQSTRIMKVVLICLLIWFYSLLTGFSPSVLRSAIMLTVYILAKSFNKHANGYNILAFTAFCLLVYNPFLTWDVGFQLSFLAVFGLIYLHPKVYKWLYFKPRWADWLWSSVALSVAAQIATFPLSIYYFHQFPLYFIFSNLFILLPITLLMYLGISILLFKLYFLAFAFEWLIIFMNDGLKWIAQLPLAGIDQIWINKVELLLLSILMIFFVIGLSKYNKHLLTASIILFFGVQANLTFKTLQISRQKRIIFFSLQKGYAAAFIQARQAILVTDLDTNNKNFKFFIQPALDELNVKKRIIINWEVDTSLNFFHKKHQQITFHKYRILLLDPHFNKHTIANMPIFDLVWLHKNPKIIMADLRATVVFKSLIADASNSAYQLKKQLEEANKIKMPYYILKKNKAYLVK